MNQNFYNQFQNNNSSSFNNSNGVNQNTQSNIESKPPKKTNFILIAIAVVAVISIVTGSILMFSGDSKSSDKNSGNDKQNIKEITYFNENKSNDSIGFNLEQSINTKKGVFVGIKGEGISSNLEFDITMLQNDVLDFNQYSKGDLLSITYDDEYYNFDLEGDSYLKDNEGEFLDNDSIVYKDGNYFVTETSIDKYLLYYLYEEVYYDGFRDGKTHGYWYAFSISFFDTIDEAKDKIDKIREVVDICIYDKEEGLDNCITEDGKSIDYKEYKYVKDVLVDFLIDYNLYVDSYENITQTKYGEINIEKYINLEGTDEDDLTKFEISFETGTLESKEGDVKDTLNGKEIIIRESNGSSNVYINQGNSYIKIRINLPYNVENSVEIIKEVLNDAFSKTK